MKKVLITGANGFIGANLCRYFLDKGWHVDAVIRPGKGWAWRLVDHLHLNLIELNLKSGIEAMSLFSMIKPSIIINCAAYGGYSNQTNEVEMYDTNFTAIRYLLEGASFMGKDFKAFIQLGTSSEYGLNSAGPDETSHTIPNSHYAISKLAATSLCQYYGKVHNVPTCVLRLGSVYGPFEDPGRLVMKACLEASKGNLIELSDIHITRDFIYIDDVCETVFHAIDHAEKKPGEIYNVANSWPCRIGQMYGNILDEYNIPLEISDNIKLNASLIKPWDHLYQWYMDCRKLREHLWTPAVSREAGIHKLRQWIEANPEIIKNMRSVYE